MTEFINLHDHMAFTCECGSVRFNLLRSGGIECAGCCKRVDASWFRAALFGDQSALIDALREMLNAGHPAYVADEYFREQLIAAREKARAAIRKATGEE